MVNFTDWEADLGASEEYAALRDYLHQDNRFVPQGGETCSDQDNAAPYINCQNSLADLQLLRFSTLNIGYHPGVLQRWRDEGCFGEIARRLGYRFELLSGDFPTEARAGKPMDITLKLRNVGFASPYNSRGLELVLRNSSTAELYQLSLDEVPDVRRWLPDDGEITLRLSGTIPSEMSAGDYEVLLHLPDPSPTLYGLPDYSIRLANSGVWEAATGYNRLHALIHIGL